MIPINTQWLTLGAHACARATELSFCIIAATMLQANMRVTREYKAGEGVLMQLFTYMVPMSLSYNHGNRLHYQNIAL